MIIGSILENLAGQNQVGVSFFLFPFFQIVTGRVHRRTRSEKLNETALLHPSLFLSRCVLCLLYQHVTDFGQSKFHSSCVPSVSITDYLDRFARMPVGSCCYPLICCRIRRYSKCAPESLVLTLVYIDRLLSASGLLFSPLTAHRSLMAAFLLAVKFNDDHFYDNAFYARVGGVPTAELNDLESSFLSAVDFRLHVWPETFEDYYNEIAAHGEQMGRQLPVIVRGPNEHDVYEEEEEEEEQGVASGEGPVQDSFLRGREATELWGAPQGRLEVVVSSL